MSHPPERIAAFAKRGNDDDPEQWYPMWIHRSVALRVLGEDGTAEWTQDDDELNQALHEWLEMYEPPEQIDRLARG